MIKIDTKAIEFFTTPWERSNSMGKDSLAKKVGFTILAILATLALGIIIPLITCWIIKLVSLVESTDTNPGTTIEKIGDYAAVVHYANPKIQELFDWFLESPDHRGGLFILDLESKSFLQHISSSKVPNQISEAYVEKMKELAPSLIHYFSEVITKHEGHNRMVISVDCFAKRGNSYNFHQDQLGTINLLEAAGLFNPNSEKNIKQWGNGVNKPEGLLFAYKKSEAGHILPTIIAKKPAGFEEQEFRQSSREELEEIENNKDMVCRPIEKHQVLVLNNLQGIHATTNYNRAEVFLGEGEGLNYFQPNNHFAFTRDIENTPIFRITASTYASDDPL